MLLSITYHEDTLRFNQLLHRYVPVTKRGVLERVDERTRLERACDWRVRSSSEMDRERVGAERSADALFRPPAQR